MKKVRLPSTFALHATDDDTNDIDALNLNYIFWEYFFSAENVKSIFDEYINKYSLSNELKSYLNFIVINLNNTNAVKDNLKVVSCREKNALYCFKTYFFILSIFNKINRNYQLSLSYGVIFNHSLKEIENFIDNDTSIISNIFNNILDNNNFFRNNTKYMLRIYWEEEACVLLLLSHMMRKRFDNIEISLDLGSVNVQADFSFWKSHHLFIKYIDNFENTYYENTTKNEPRCLIRIEDLGFGNKSLFARLFNTKCYWGKCTFCLINSRFISERTVSNLNEYAIRAIDQLVDGIKKINGLFSLFFEDEAIEVSVLIYFAEQLLKHKIDIKWSVRSRFSDKFTLDNCKILAKSGLRFLGFGLESVNQRVLELMKKREREYPKEELNTIFKNCDKAGINVHACFMIGFPSETKEETDETIEFVDYQLKNRKYFTYSANVFSLMKGSYVYKHPEELGIEICDKYEGEKLSGIGFVDNSPGEKYTRDELTYLSRKAYAKLFFKEDDLDYATIQLGYHFWDFLDRTALFYEYKLVNSRNPYLYEVDVDDLSDEMLDQNFKLLPLFISSEGSNCEYHNVLNEKRVSINENIKNMFTFFITNFQSDATLRDNIGNCYDRFCINEDKQDIARMVETINKKNIFEKYITKLIKDTLLYT